MKRQEVEARVQREAEEVPWLFSCELVVERSSNLVERARDAEELLELDPPVVLVVPVVPVVLRRVARDRHEKDQVSYEGVTLSIRLECPEWNIPVRIKLSVWSILGAQGKQGTQLAAKL
jgi:hypothetical protein